MAVGISSGANLLLAIKLQDKLGEDKIIVTVFLDGNKKYISTDLMKSEPVKSDLISTEVELIGFHEYRMN